MSVWTWIGCALALLIVLGALVIRADGHEG